MVKQDDVFALADFVGIEYRSSSTIKHTALSQARGTSLYGSVFSRVAAEIAKDNARQESAEKERQARITRVSATTPELRLARFIRQEFKDVFAEKGEGRGKGESKSKAPTSPAPTTPHDYHSRKDSGINYAGSFVNQVASPESLVDSIEFTPRKNCGPGSHRPASSAEKNIGKGKGKGEDRGKGKKGHGN